MDKQYTLKISKQDLNNLKLAVRWALIDHLDGTITLDSADLASFKRLQTLIAKAK